MCTMYKVLGSVPSKGVREEEHIKVKHKIIKKTLIVQKKGKKIK